LPGPALEPLGISRKVDHMFDLSGPRSDRPPGATAADGTVRTGSEAEPPSAPPTPPVLLDLPDGQQLRVLLLEQWQSPDGRWWLTVEIQAWAHVREGQRDRSEPAPFTVTAAASHVHRIEGVSYSAVRTHRYRPAAAAPHRGLRSST
jgi:hypothetical protein